MFSNFGMTYGSFQDAMDFARILTRHKARLSWPDFKWIRPFFLRSQDSVPATAAFLHAEREALLHTLQRARKYVPRLDLELPNYPNSATMPDINQTDLNNFMEAALVHGRNRLLFSTTNSVGFAWSGFKPDDEIWALDGAKVPFILRKTGIQTYRIMCDCYLWAALELDYWNPGTKKGRWSEHRVPHQEKQTHIIEIH
jgi:hypothetical protein